MTFFRKRLAGRKAGAIGILLFLIAYQGIALLRFHSQEYFVSPPEFDPPLNHDKEEHYTAIRDHGQPRHPQSPDIEVVNEVIHRAFFGLGHRLHRSAAVYHLAQSLSLSQNQTSSVLAANHRNQDQREHMPSITHFRFHWESCLPADEVHNASAVGDVEKEYNVFRYLFGDDVWNLNFNEDSRSASQKSPVAMKDIGSNIGRDGKPPSRRNMIVIRNDVTGYIAGQLYKDLQLPVSYTNEKKLTAKSSFTQYEAIVDKVMRSDVEFYQRLVDTYQFKKELREFQDKHRWNERPLVVGLHLRAGNGEEWHFKDSGRASSLDLDETTMIARLVQLINKAVIHETKRIADQTSDPVLQEQPLRPLLFVATDTAHLLPLIDKAVNQRITKEGSVENDPTKITPGMLEVVTWPQYRLPKNAGVTFDSLQGQGGRCLQGWRSSMSDASLLNSVDMLIAAKRSTFTQSLPLTLGFGRNHEQHNSNRVEHPAFADTNLDNESVIRRNNDFSFCEVSESDFVDMTCFADAKTWLFRGENKKVDQPTQDMSKDNPKMKQSIRSFSVAESTPTDSDQIHTNRQVNHKITILLPDVDPPSEFNRARDFLRRKNTIPSMSPATGTRIDESVFRYGRSKMTQKYRDSHQMTSKTNSSWNFVLNPNS